ncbi:YmfQ family protein [Clostridioides difficile]|uniref:YmfQ family protein n=1 Tax=Clostridioides difficile TaxID=1496 RepID=UPI0014417793|nr:YmfQ family protein [Clostridioides difficile]MCP8381347.1 YmfQ family protein [Clostridioides difficile]NKN19691.1 YmfQ family protein [Clostridioides difficile]
MDKEINLINYLPQILQDKEEYIKVFNVENKEIKTLHDKLKDLSNDQFLEDLTISGIKRWEKIMSITPKSNESLEDRRFRIFSKYISKPPYSERFLRNWLDNIVGEGNYELTINNATYNIHLESDARNQDWFNEVHLFVSNIKPCNMTLDYTRVLVSKDNGLYFGATTITGHEITIYPWSPSDIETQGEINIISGNGFGYQEITIY